MYSQERRHVSIRHALRPGVPGITRLSDPQRRVRRGRARDHLVSERQGGGQGGKVARVQVILHVGDVATEIVPTGTTVGQIVLLCF